MRYRSDIDGLRAVAVIPVCLFHAGLPPFTGGYSGVDVFFVISGYLMASLIGGDLAQGRFSLLAFYERRIRRIFPALFAVLLFCVIAAAVILPPRLFYDFGNTLVATVFFSSNILFALSSSNYFSAPVEFNPLLHTWSLAVEEQFYIAFPIFLVLIWRWGRRWAMLITAMFALLSIAIGVWGSANFPTASFYLLPSRAWELLFGAVLALRSLEPLARERAPEGRWLREIGGIAGISLIVGGFLAFDAETAFPGLPALVPCVGVVLLLHFNRQGDTFVARLLGTSPFIFVGKISYSLYLWHWPLLVFVEKYRLFGEPSDAGRLATIGAAFLASIVTWHYIEQPFRGRHSYVGRRTVLAGAAVCTILIALAGQAVKSSDGWASRFPGIASVALDRQFQNEAKNAAWQEYSRATCFIPDNGTWGRDRCFLNRHAKENALLWGDSFANNYAYGFLGNTRAPFNLLQYTSPQCPPVLEYAAVSRPQCAPFISAVTSVLKDYDIRTVIMAANWQAYVKRRKMTYADVAKTVRYLRSLGIRVVLVGQSPEFAFVYPDEYLYTRYGALITGGKLYAAIDDPPGINRPIDVATNADTFFDPMATLCDGDECVFWENGAYLFADYGHYTHVGSVRMVSSLLIEIERGAGSFE